MIRSIVEKHVDEASFLWILRDSAAIAPNYTRDEIARLDSQQAILDNHPGVPSQPAKPGSSKLSENPGSWAKIPYANTSKNITIGGRIKKYLQPRDMIHLTSFK